MQVCFQLCLLLAVKWLHTAWGWEGRKCFVTKMSNWWSSAGEVTSLVTTSHILDTPTSNISELIRASVHFGDF